MEFPKIPKAGGLLDAIGAQNKAVAGGVLVAGSGINTLILAALAHYGVGEMPTAAEIAMAVEAIIKGLVAYAAVYMIPNIVPGRK